jgi:hypothetical protein
MLGFHLSKHRCTAASASGKKPQCFQTSLFCGFDRCPFTAFGRKKALLSSEEDHHKFSKADFENYSEGERKVAVDKAITAVDVVFCDTSEPFRVAAIYLLPERKKKIKDFLDFIIEQASSGGGKKDWNRHEIMTDMDSLLSMCHKLWTEQLTHDAVSETPKIPSLNYPRSWKRILFLLAEKLHCDAINSTRSPIN